MDIRKMSGEKVDDYFARLVEEGYILKDIYQGVCIEDVTKILESLNQYTDDKRDTIWCLLDDEFPSLFSKADHLKIADGASIAHIGGYVGILKRHGKRLDREGRDYWAKPLVDIAALEPVTYKDGIFIEGHIKPKSPNSAYRLSKYFTKLLKNAKHKNFPDMFDEYVLSVDKRLAIFNKIVEETKRLQGESAHKQLIDLSISVYAVNYLPGYIPVFTDSADGDRITEQVRQNLEYYGIVFGDTEDVWPDAILYNKEVNSLWFIEAVTSDGEADQHKIDGLKTICKKSNKNYGGTTTTYETFKYFASRQQAENNLARDTYVWIKECPDKQFKVC